MPNGYLTIWKEEAALIQPRNIKKTFKGTMTTASFRINRKKLSFSSKKDGTLLRIQSKCEWWEDGKGKMETAVVFTPVSSAVGQKSWAKPMKFILSHAQTLCPRGTPLLLPWSLCPSTLWAKDTLLKTWTCLISLKDKLKCPTFSRVRVHDLYQKCSLTHSRS